MSTNTAAPAYRIHPAIGIARLGDSPDAFCISPERPAGLPLACDADGNVQIADDGHSEVTVENFKDDQGRIKRQAARFQIFVYDDDAPQGRPLRVGDPVKGGGNSGVLVEVYWQVYLANKKSAWYEFDALSGEHGYSADHTLRNANIVGADARQQLIIDPGPRIVSRKGRRRATFDRGGSDLFAPIFPPPLEPRSIDTLGEILTDDAGRLLVLGGHGNSGTMNSGFGQPRIDDYANNDGWFDDTSDGVVMARLVIYSKDVDRLRFVDVEYPAWVIVASPSYVPEILNMVTLDDVLYDLAIREFAARTDLFGEVGTFDDPQCVDARDPEALQLWKRGRLTWNPDFRPWFFRDVWPILFRADEFMHLTNVLEQSNFPHNQTERGNFDPKKLSLPPIVNEHAWEEAKSAASALNQSGALVVEALEPTLALLEVELRARAGGRDIDFVQAFDQSAIQGELREAAAEFASAVFPEGAGAAGDEYLRGWKAVYERAASAQPGSEYAEKYDAAKRALAERVEKVEAELVAALAEASGLEKKVLRTALSRRMPAPESTDTSAPRPAGDAIDFVFKQFRTGQLLADTFAAARREATHDLYRIYRLFLYELVRQPGEENIFRAGTRPNSRTFNLPLMPLLCGDNPLSNETPSKFLRLTDYQHFVLRQWVEGRFYNEENEGWVPKKIDPFRPYDGWVAKTGSDLDRGVLANALGGAFCPGGEVGWLVRNPSVFREPYRLRADPDFYPFGQTAAQANQNAGNVISPDDYLASVEVTLAQGSDYARGLQPGDLTKQMAVPWQADFNECTTQPIDITYEGWNEIDPDNPNDPRMRRERQVWETLWWPAHRPLQTWEVTGFKDGAPQFKYLNWARGVPQTNAGNLKMVTEWARLGFVVRNPYLPESKIDVPSPDQKYISVERGGDDE